jgi:hypothetical protein
MYIGSEWKRKDPINPTALDTIQVTFVPLPLYKDPPFSEICL